MATTHFYLKDPNTSSPSIVSLYYLHRGKRFVYSTGYKIKPSQWSKSKERALSTAPDRDAINTALDRLAQNAARIFEELLEEHGTVTKKHFKDRLDVLTGRASSAVSLFAYIEKFIGDRAESSEYRKGSIQVYRSTFKHLRAFAKYRRSPGGEFDFADVDYNLIEQLKRYLINAGLTTNTVNKTVSTFKTFLNEAKREGLNRFTAYQDAVNAPKETSDAIYLTRDELEGLYLFQFSRGSLDRVRDLFIIGAFTGLRYSDFIRIKPQHVRTIEGEQVIDIITQKTGKRVYIPLHPFVKATLEKYDYHLPEITNQKMNEYLKEMGKEAGLDGDFTKGQTKGGRKVTKTYKKYQLITTHTARRSFATNAYKSGIPAPAIMKITGHTTESSFMKYLKISDEENAVILSQYSFFKPQPLRAVK